MCLNICAAVHSEFRRGKSTHTGNGQGRETYDAEASSSFRTLRVKDFFCQETKHSPVIRLGLRNPRKKERKHIKNIKAQVARKDGWEDAPAGCAYIVFSGWHEAPSLFVCLFV